jgi:CheY-like chemotaxis protein
MDYFSSCVVLRFKVNFVSGDVLMEKHSFLDGKRVLIADDEPDILESIKELLPMCDVVGATSFDEAKELLKNQYFDMAILDIMGIEGYKLLEIANQRKVTAIMLTAHALSPENIVRSYKEGAASYVPKEEMAQITTFLNDILEAKEKGKNPWWRWLERLGNYYCKKKFGPDWQEKDKEFWEQFGDS